MRNWWFKRSTRQQVGQIDNKSHADPAQQANALSGGALVAESPDALLKRHIPLLQKALLQIVGGDKLIIPFC
ncbi:hypothetical protein J3S88_26510 (plasmid) [Citrobacter freundii]|uniref:hypothetical protein n=1 Tax=Citrobacter freundii TaxID=546 RepID=UPI0020A223DF|nr:hypothetical protein [Citrobacter freundii]UTA35222.1 hypothetical protein J3S88_25650 [Citrobacter freundii]UTA35543.1 hypothetical protein J3S88_26510 [Citrobacter freundii]